MTPATAAFAAALLALLAGVAIGKAWERYKLRDGRWIDRRRARDSHHYVLGLNFLVSNQIDLAIEELSQAARVDADALEIHLILGNIHRERGQVTRAIQVHQSLLQRQKLSRTEHAYVMLCLGLDYKRGGFVDRALEAFREVLRLDPGNFYALLYLQKLHEEQHQWDDARRVRSELLGLAGPESPARSHEVLAYIEHALGRDAVQRGDSDTARRHFLAALEHDQTAPPAHIGLGDLAAATGDHAAAAACWERLVDTAPDRAYLVFDRLESAYAALGVPDRFAERCRRLMDARPQDWRARLALGTHTARQGRPEEALTLLLGALARNPHGLTVHEAIWDLLVTLQLNRDAVMRYVEAAKSAVFYLDPHICLKCRYRSTELLWQCPHCHEWNTFVEERIAPVKDVSES